MSRLTKKIEKSILKDLLNNPSGMYVYKIPSIYKISVQDVFNFINEKSNWIKYENGRITIHGHSRAAVRTTISAKILDSTDKLGKDNIPGIFEGDKIGIHDFYTPKILKSKR